MSRTPSTVHLAFATVAGALLLVAGSLILVRPAVLEGSLGLSSTLGGIDPGTVLLVLVAVLILFTPTLGILGRLHAESPRPLAQEIEGEAGSPSRPGADMAMPLNSEPPVTPQPRHEVPTVGADLEQALEWAIDYEELSRRDREHAREVLVDALRPIAAAAYARHTGCTESAAISVVDAGTWTEDVRAGAFLADEDGISTPLRIWLFDLLTTTPYRRHLEHTIAAIAAIQSSQPTGVAVHTDERGDQGVTRAP